MQLQSYKTINEQAERQLHVRGSRKRDRRDEKGQSYVSINAQTMADRTPTHIAEMMMQGNVMGIIDITKNRNKYADADKPVVTLATRR